MAKRSSKHPGFKAVASKIAHNKNPQTGKPYGAKAGAAIAASAARNASAGAKKANPRLKRV